MLYIICAVVLSTILAAQPAKPPETYSFLATSADMTVKVNRNGSKELMERTSIAHPNGFHDRVLYDFQAHRLYTLDLNSRICSTQEYESAYAPPLFDSIGGSGEMLAGFASHPPNVLGTENINGIATNRVEIDLPENQGKYKMWLDQKYSFVVKWVLGPQSYQELSQLSYAPSPASLFVPPQGCTKVGGVTGANGGHAEMTVEKKIPEQTKQLGPVKTRMGQTSAGAAVTAIRLRLVPESYSGPCPTPMKLQADITTDGPGTVWYRFLAGAVALTESPEGTLAFSAAGTQTVTLNGALRATPRVPHASLIAIMQDEQGNHGPRNLSSNPADYNRTCTAK